MKTAFLLLFISFFASWSFAQQDDKKKQAKEKETKLLQNINVDSLELNLKRREVRVQEQVSVEAPDYPGLEVSVENPARGLANYKPYTKQELQAYSDLLVDYHLTNYDRSETARPHKQHRIFRVTVPD
jgi:ABC-type transporter MlaC component